MASKNRHPPFLLAFCCCCLFATFSTSGGYKIEPEMSCKLSGVPMFVAEIPVDAANRQALFVDDADKAMRAYVENNGTRCESSNAANVTVNGTEILRIWARLDCGETEVHGHDIIPIKAAIVVGKK